MNSLWYPLCAQNALTTQALAVQVLGQALVLWRDAQGRAVLLHDRCPHRGARLSLGRVQNNTLACSYHGWRFDSEGRCVAIPALPGFQPPDSYKACRFHAMEDHGLVWGCLGPDPADRPQLPPLPSRYLLLGPFDVAVSAPRVVENFLDTAHFAYVHEGWLGTAEQPEVPAHQVAQTSDGRPVVEHYPAWQPRATASSAAGGWVSYRYEVLGPYSALLSKQPEDGSPGDSYTLWTCPVDDEHCRVWMGQYTADTTSSDEQLLAFQTTIFAQDKPVLESQTPKRLPLSGGELHCAADRLSVAYRRYLKAVGATCGVC